MSTSKCCYYIYTARGGEGLLVGFFQLMWQNSQTDFGNLHLDLSEWGAPFVAPTQMATCLGSALVIDLQLPIICCLACTVPKRRHSPFCRVQHTIAGLLIATMKCFFPLNRVLKTPHTCRCFSNRTPPPCQHREESSDSTQPQSV